MSENALRERMVGAADSTSTGLAICAAFASLLALIDLGRLALGALAAAGWGETPVAMVVGAAQVVGWLHVLAFLVTAGLWLQWSLRVRQALVARVGSAAVPGPRAVAGYWFVPFYNLVGPYEVLERLWHLAESPGSGRTTEEREAGFRSESWRVWWTLWAFSGLLLFGVGRLGRAASTAEAYSVLVGLHLIGCALRAGAGVKAVSVVGSLTRRVASRMLEPAVVLPAPASTATAD